MAKCDEVRMTKLPKCDFCECLATYDAKTKYGPWANMCETHWIANAHSKSLGLGLGQRLVLDSDV